MNKKLVGAVLSSIFFIVYLAMVISLLVYTQLTEVDKMPIGIFIFLLFIFCIPFIGIIYALYSRVDEIHKGEEEEAKKYQEDL